MSLSLGQEREFNRDMEVQKFLDDQKKVYELYKPFNTEVLSLIGNIALIAPLRPEKEEKGKYATKSKGELRVIIADSINEICTPATAYAQMINDNKLLSAVRYRSSDITNAKDGDVNGIVAVVVNALTPLLTDPAFAEYNITEDALTSLTEMGTAFDNSIGVANVIDTGSSIANKEMNKAFKAIRGNLRTLRLLLPYFIKKNPKFVEGFNKSAAVDLSGIRRSGLEGTVTCDNQPVEGATITAEGKKKIALSDNKGAYRLIKLKVTDMKITITMPGYETKVIDVKILRGEIIPLNITLQRQIINISATA